MADQTFAVNCGFFDAINSDRAYSADEMNRPYRRVISNGVFATPSGTPSTDLQVAASSGMNIICKKGEGLFGDKWFENPSSIAITVPSNTGTVPRIDSVLVQVDTRTSGRVGNIVHRTGTPASSPVPPAINQTEGVVEYRLANIRVNAGVSAVTGSMITDRRGSSDCPWVTSLIYQVDTSTLYDQWQAAYAEYFETEKAIWDAWYAQLTEDLDVSMTLDRHTNTVTTNAQTTGTIPIGLAYNHNTDILEVYINGLRAIEGTHYIVVNDDTSIMVENQLDIGQTVTFVVMRSVISGSAMNITVLLQELESQIAGIAGGTPTVVDDASDMIDTGRIYILSTDSKWYYYSSTEDWVAGGTYGGVPTDTTLSISGLAADAKAVGDALEEKADADDVPDISVVGGRLVINGTSYELGGVGIASITKTGTAELVDTYTILMTDGTSTTFTVTNGDASDAKIQGFIEDWLEEHPEATTTVQDGAITLAKLAPEVTQKLSDVKLNYKWYAAGYMRASVRTFQGWTHNVVWEPDLGKAVGIVISSNTAHEYANPWYRVTIDPSGYMSEYEAVTLYDTDGTTEYTSTAYYMGSLCRLSNGTYMAIDSGHDIYISSDYCKTFVRQQTYAFDGTGSMFGLKQLSNGRLLVGFGGNRNGFYYSDDLGETWTATSADNSGLGQQAYPSGAFKPFEPCFIECGNGKVVCYARKSTAAYSTGGSLSETVYRTIEPAMRSVSTDYGATWSAWSASTTITDMTASNAKYAVIDGVVHMVFASRYTHTDGNLRIFYTYASIEDAYSDNWATPVMIDAGHWDASTAHDAHDGGYPSVWTDGIGNLFAVYYDGDGSGTEAGANWRLCMGAPVIKKPAVSDGSGAFNVGYTQKVVDLKIASIMTKINELYMLIGELPPAADSYDGSSLVTDGLEAFFDVTNQSKWDGSLLTSMVGELTARAKPSSGSGQISSSNTTPSVFNNGFANIGSLYFTKTIAEIVGSSVTAFTVEYICYITGNSISFYAKTTSTVNVNNTTNPNVYSGKSGNALFSSVSVPHHVCAVFESGKVTWYVNGNKKTTETTQVAFADILASYPLPNAHQTSAGSALGDVRFYSKALSDDEIMNNFLYTQAKVDYIQAPVFTTS